MYAWKIYDLNKLYYVIQSNTKIFYADYNLLYFNY